MFGDFLDHEAAIGSVFLAIPCAILNLLISPLFFVIFQVSWKYPLCIVCYPLRRLWSYCRHGWLRQALFYNSLYIYIHTYTYTQCVCMYMYTCTYTQLFFESMQYLPLNQNFRPEVRGSLPASVRYSSSTASSSGRGTCSWQVVNQENWPICIDLSHFAAWLVWFSTNYGWWSSQPWFAMRYGRICGLLEFIFDPQPDGMWAKENWQITGMELT